MWAYRLVTFDVDGTILDSVPAIVDGIRSASRELNLPEVSEETAKSVIGLGFKDIVRIVVPGLPEERFDEYVATYVRFFLQRDPHLLLFPETVDLLQALRKRGFRTAIATGKTRKGLRRIIDRHRLGALFDYSVCSDEAEPKPHPLMLQKLLAESKLCPSEMVMVGDSEHDVMLAKNAGVDVIAVTWGAAERRTLQALKPELIVDSFPELAARLFTASYGREFQRLSEV